MHRNTLELLPYVPDLRKHKFHLWISNYHWLPIVTLAVLALALGGWSCLLWAVFLRTVSDSIPHGEFGHANVGLAALETGDTRPTVSWVACLPSVKAGTTIIMLYRRQRATVLTGMSST
jgi:stearoyl-CoA desaturase (delta-9 desaturase)